MKKGRSSRWLTAAAAVLAGVAVTPGSAQAAAGARGPQPSYHLGSYAGTIVQRVPRGYTGKIQFSVQRGTITGLAFTVGTLCKGTKVTDSDALPQFKFKVASGGAFSYAGTIRHRVVQFSGRLTDGRAAGTLFVSFPWGSERCSMIHPAPFAATG